MQSKCLPRLLSLKQAQEAYGINYWHLRTLVIDGVLKCVRLPGTRIKVGGRVVANSRDHKLRKILIDGTDIERLIEESKELERY